jgi:septal ring factor EnvC (AmiA/AmiB activator)
MRPLLLCLVLLGSATATEAEAHPSDLSYEQLAALVAEQQRTIIALRQRNDELNRSLQSARLTIAQLNAMLAEYAASAQQKPTRPLPR